MAAWLRMKAGRRYGVACIFISVSCKQWRRNQSGSQRSGWRRWRLAAKYRRNQNDRTGEEEKYRRKRKSRWRSGKRPAKDGVKVISAEAAHWPSAWRGKRSMAVRSKRRRRIIKAESD